MQIDFYKLYNKAKTSNTKLSELIEDCTVKKINLEQILYSITPQRRWLIYLSLQTKLFSENSAKKSTKTAIEPIKLDLGGETRIYIGKE